MEKTEAYLVQNPKTAYRIIDGEAVIVDLESSKLYSLNPVATMIWETLSKRVELSRIVDSVMEEFEVEREIAEKDCVEFIRDFSAKGLVITEGNLK